MELVGRDAHHVPDREVQVAAVASSAAFAARRTSGAAERAVQRMCASRPPRRGRRRRGRSSEGGGGSGGGGGSSADGWACMHCTLINDAWRKKCLICMKSRKRLPEEDDLKAPRILTELCDRYGNGPAFASSITFKADSLVPLTRSASHDYREPRGEPRGEPRERR